MCIFYKGFEMTKKLLLTLFLIVFANNADAAVGQSASSALSYRSMVSVSVPDSLPDDSDHNNAKIIKKKSHSKHQKKEKELHTVDMMSSFINSVWINPGDEIEVSLKETPEIQWRSSYNSANLKFVSENKEGEIRKFRFWQKSLGGSSIYFDCLDMDGKIIKNKILDIKVK